MEKKVEIAEKAKRAILAETRKIASMEFDADATEEQIGEVVRKSLQKIVDVCRKALKDQNEVPDEPEEYQNEDTDSEAEETEKTQ